MKLTWSILFAISLSIGIYDTLSAQSDSLATETFVFEPDKVAKEAVSKILKYTGLSPNFIIIEAADISTAIAFIKDNKRYIAYNPDFIYKLRDQVQTDWAAVSVLAHEIGHHFLGHTLRTRANTPGDELAADKFSGFILFQMGATLEEAQATIATFGHDMDTSKHPPKSARLAAVTNGWKEAESLRHTKAYNDEPDIQEDPIVFQFKCRFVGDENLYFVDDKNRVIWYDNYGKPIVIGSAEPSDNKNYDWYYLYNDQRFCVDFKGNIWSETTYGSALKVGTVEGVTANDPE